MQTLADTEMLGVVPEWLALPGTVLGVFNVVVAMALGNSFKLFKDGDGAPFVPTASEKLKSLFSGETGCLRPDGQALNLSTCADLHLIDLGSGTGSIVRAATRIGGFGRASGYELNPLLYQLSVVASLGRANEHFHLVSLWDADLGTADVVVVYGYPSFIEPLGIQLASELKDGALVVSNAYPIPNCVPHLELLNEIPVETPVWSPDASSSLWLYRVSRRSEDDTVPSTAMAAAGVPRRAAAQQHRTAQPRCCIARDLRSELASRKLGRRRRGSAASDAVRDAVLRWSERPPEEEARSTPGERADDDGHAEAARAAVEAMLERRSQADSLAAFCDSGAVDEMATLLQQAQAAEEEAAAALARAAKLRAAANEAMSKLKAEAVHTQMSEAMAAWSDKMENEQRGEEDLRAAMQAAMERSGGER